MNEEQDLTEQMIKKELENEAQKIREAISDFDGGELSAEQKSEMKENLHKKIDEYELQKVLAQLPEKYREAMETGLKVMEKDEEFSEEIGITPEEVNRGGRKIVYRKKRLRVYAVLAAALIMAMAIGVNSFGGAERVIEIVKRAVGGREVVQVDSNEDNLIIETESEEEAYQTIKDELGIESVKITIRPTELVFESAEINPAAQMAELYYKYGNENAIYIINASQISGSWGIDVEDEVTDSYIMKVKNVPVEIKEYQTPATKTKRYSANFTHKKVDYFFIGTMDRGVFEKIINNLHFFS